jgi:hypothetical protein
MMSPGNRNFLAYVVHHWLKHCYVALDSALKKQLNENSSLGSFFVVLVFEILASHLLGRYSVS